MVTYYVGLSGFIGSCVAFSTDAGNWAVAGFFLGMLVTIIQDVHWFRRRNAHPHDLQLVELLTDLIQGTKTDLFLNNHDFESSSYDDRQLAPFAKIEQEWRGVDYEFVDRKLQTHWKLFKTSMDEFTTITTHDAPLRGAGFYHLLPGDIDRDSAEFNDLKTRARRANELARQMFKEFQAIRRIYLRYKEILAIKL